MNKCINCKYASYKHKAWACMYFKMALKDNNAYVKACANFSKK